MTVAATMKGDHLHLKVRQRLLLAMIVASGKASLEQLFGMNVGNSVVVIGVQKHTWTVQAR